MSMEINPLSSYNTNSEHRGRSSKPEKANPKPTSDSFSGPNIEQKKSQLSSIDAIRHQKVTKIKEELETGSYFNEDKLKKTIEALLKGL